MRIIVAIGCVAGVIAVVGPGCSGSEDEEIGEALQSAKGVAQVNCDKVEPHDVLIADLFEHSVIADYPLTRLYVDENDMVTGPDLPDLVAGDLELVNSVDPAREAVIAALNKVTGIGDYGHVELGEEEPECSSVPAWTPLGDIEIATVSHWVSGPGVEDRSWKTTHKEFGKQCPLIKRHGNEDLIDPPGDGSTNLPPSSTVSATGVVANAFGLCPSGTAVSTYCKLSYAEGINYTGRWCQYYYGQLRCVLK